MIQRRLSIVGYRFFFFDGAAIAVSMASIAAASVILRLIGVDYTKIHPPIGHRTATESLDKFLNRIELSRDIEISRREFAEGKGIPQDVVFNRLHEKLLASDRIARSA